MPKVALDERNGHLGASASDAARSTPVNPPSPSDRAAPAITPRRQMLRSLAGALAGGAALLALAACGGEDDEDD